MEDLCSSSSKRLSHIGFPDFVGGKNARNFAIFETSTKEKKFFYLSEMQGNANRNNNEISSHICQNGYYQKEHKQHRLVRMWRKENPCTLLLCLVAQLCKILCDTVDCNPPGSSVHGDSPGKSTGVGCHALLQGIFPTQGQNSGLQQCRQILYHLSHQGFFTI